MPAGAAGERQGLKGMSMEYRHLGRSGLVVSTLGLGTSTAAGNIAYDRGQADAGTDTQAFRGHVRRALDLGVTAFDTAGAYAGGRAEELLGQALAGVPREDLVISTKAFYPTGPGRNSRGLSRKHVTEALHGSLRRLGLDYVDIYLAHRYDYATPLAETMQAFADLVRAGKALYIGVSEWTPTQILQAARLAQELGITLVCDQVVYSMLWQVARAQIEPLCADLGIGLVACCPIASGLLTGKYLPGQPAPQGSRAAGVGNKSLAVALRDTEQLSRIQQLRPLAAEAGLTMSQLAVAWALRGPSVASTFVGVSRTEQLDELAAAVDRPLDDDLVQRIDEILGDSVERDPLRTLSPSQRP